MAREYGIDVGLGAAAVVAATAAAALFPEPAARLAVIAVAVAVSTASADHRWAGASTGLLGYLLFNGFLVNRLGELTWAGRTSVEQVALIAGAVAAGLVWQKVRVMRARAAWDGALNELVRESDG